MRSSGLFYSILLIATPSITSPVAQLQDGSAVVMKPAAVEALASASSASVVAVSSASAAAAQASADAAQKAAAQQAVAGDTVVGTPDNNFGSNPAPAQPAGNTATTTTADPTKESTYGWYSFFTKNGKRAEDLVNY